MIGYATVGTNDIGKAREFYGPLLGEMGAKQVMAMDNGLTLYGTSFEQPMMGVTPPYDGGAATVGNGTMVALQQQSREAVDRVHAKALELGGTCEGEPGLRGDESMGFYGAYFRDPDGNKLCAFKIGG